MRGIEQTDAAHEAYGQMRNSLWTGDPGYRDGVVNRFDRFPRNHRRS